MPTANREFVDVSHSSGSGATLCEHARSATLAATVLRGEAVVLELDANVASITSTLAPLPEDVARLRRQAAVLGLRRLEAYLRARAEASGVLQPAEAGGAASP